MNHPQWRDSVPPPQPTRHRIRSRQDFEDSVISAQLEDHQPHPWGRRPTVQPPAAAVIAPPREPVVRATAEPLNAPPAPASRSAAHGAKPLPTAAVSLAGAVEPLSQSPRPWMLALMAAAVVAALLGWWNGVVV